MHKIALDVTQDDCLDRIDKFIRAKEESLSRSRIQLLLQQQAILVNDDPVVAKYKVHVGDHIAIQVEDPSDMPALPEDIPLDIRYEDRDVIVINKGKGMVVHPANGHQGGTLVNALLYHCKDLSGINGILRPGIVHRIDKDTTGLLIVAKNDNAHTSLAQQLQSKRVNRLYYALVHGVIEHEFGTIDAPIGRDVKDRQKMCVTSHHSKDARTHFKVIERFAQYTLVECRLETGRTHQIRVHMQYIGHPVVGDEKYSYRKTMKTNGQLLHAHQLTFCHPVSGKTITVQAPLPNAFETILQKLRNNT